ncbi:alpha/beta hydrolase [Ammoniphilus resinae]|uniref:Acetyl esterase n=1 Tax=Ammoniphilus resinae TaxID=861532 RepID=A0ABS4GL39_9BACL|nr:alpha/beta hydrolase [Ammoniphilus resinae]MBP1930986.1 acetyl esterase [Ammoniphilus resinae]
MSLKPHVIENLRLIPSTEMTPEEMIASRDIEHTLVPPVEQRPQVASVQDHQIPGPAGHIPIRIYTPEGEGPFPIIVYFHGGGFVLLSVETHDVVCRLLARETGCKVVSVDYRLAPEHPFPAAPEDCFAATKWVDDHREELNAEGTPLYVAGDSAGGNLATVVCLMAREQGGPTISKQVLLYPVTDFHHHGSPSPYPSYQENAVGFGLSNLKMSHFWNFYLEKEEHRTHPYASPIKADLNGLPPALILTIEKDVLRDEGEEYGKRLQEAGVPVTMTRFEGTIHGFLRTFPDSEESREAHRLVAQFIKE